MTKKNSKINNSNTDSHNSDLSKVECSVILDAIPDIIIKFDSDKKITWWNKGLIDVVTIPAKKLLSHSFSDLFFPYAGESTDSIFNYILAQGSYETDVALMTREGNRRYHLKGTLLEEDDLKRNDILVIARDVSERNTLSEGYKRNLYLLQKLIDSLPFFIFLTSPYDEYILANKKYCEFTGLLASEIIGFTNHEIFTEKLADYFTRENDKVLSERCSVHYEDFVEINRNNVNVSIDKFPLFDDENNIYAICCVAEDVTAQYQLQRQLQQTQKMEAIGQLTGGIAHDFNNVLASIMGYTGLIKRRAIHNNDETIKGYLSQITRSGERARDLVQQLLAFSRGDVGDLQILQPEPLAEEAMKMLASIIPSSIKLNLNVEKNISNHYIEADPVQFNQSVMNLVINAKDAIVDEVGYIDVSLEYVPFIKGVCDSCHASFEGSYIQLAVSDSGTGISTDILERIFDPFFTTKDIGKGSGMGLSMLHGIIHASAGHIIVQSNPTLSNQYKTTIKVFFPEIKDKNIKEEMGKYRVTPLLHRKFSGKNILVIDDEPLITSYLNDLLEYEGYNVILFNTAIDGLNYFKRNNQLIDLIITDQTMPGLTGLEIAKNIFELKYQLPIILCTGYSDFASTTVSSNYGIDIIINKPFDNDMLLENIRLLLTKYQKPSGIKALPI